MLIPWMDLDEDTLKNIAQSFVLREGTDYGAEELQMEVKVEQVLEQIKSGEALIIYSESEETVDIISKERFNKNLNDQ